MLRSVEQYLQELGGGVREREEQRYPILPIFTRAAAEAAKAATETAIRAAEAVEASSAVAEGTVRRDGGGAVGGGCD